MKARKLKSQFPGATLNLAASEPPFAGPARDKSKLMSCVLMLQRFLGVMLSSIAVSAQVGNVLVCVSLLLLGPAVILEFLPK